MEPRDTRSYRGRPPSERPNPADAEAIRRKIEDLKLALSRAVEDGGGPGAAAGAGEAGAGAGVAGLGPGAGAAGQAGAWAAGPLAGPQAAAPIADRDPEPRLDIGAVEGATEITSAHGRCLVIERRLRECPSLERLGRAHQTLVGGEGEPQTGFAFLDLETTGLSATPLFLAGMLVEREGTLRAVQLLARDYSEERCLIGMLDDLLRETRVCITFNGKSFDLPYLRERAKYHRLALEAQPEQLDLLHHARRRWKHDLPDCRLVTLEWYILGRRRMGDVGGWEVPCIYHEFVHTKDATRLKGVLRHNLMDVLAMAELLVSLAEA